VADAVIKANRPSGIARTTGGCRSLRTSFKNIFNKERDDEAQGNFKVRMPIVIDGRRWLLKLCIQLLAFDKRSYLLTLVFW